MSATSPRPTIASQATLYDHLEQALGIAPIHSDTDLARAVEDRLPTSVVTALVNQGLTENEVFHMVIPRRTFAHRKARQEPLTRDESDRAVRMARILALAEQVFGDDEKGLGWLRGSKRRFEDRAPLELLTTEAGARLVEELLLQIDEGMVA